MTHDELIDMIDWLDSQTTNAAAQAANFLRQIVDAQPEHWILELRWTDRSEGAAWSRYDNYATAEGARHIAALSAGSSTESRVIPLYRLPLED